MSHMEDMKSMIEVLTSKAKSQLDGNIDCVDTEEFGEVIDMIKDLADAKYKCVVTKSMEEKDEDSEILMRLNRLDEDRRGYGGRYPISRRGYEYREEYNPNYRWDRDMDRQYGRMYYTDGNGNSGNSSGGRMYYTDNGQMDSASNLRTMTNRNYTESRYDRARRGYEESKEMHQANTAEDKQAKVASLEEYMRSISDDITDMIHDATPEEKTLLRTKLQTLATRV